MTEFDFARRIARLQRKIAEWRAGGVLLCATDGFDANVHYYSGDSTHPAAIFATRSNTLFASLHPKDFEGLFDECIPLQQLRKRLKEELRNPGKLAVDDKSPYAGAAVRTALKARKRIVPLGEKLEELRLVKDAGEQREIMNAAMITRKAIAAAENEGFAGKSGHEIAGVMEAAARNEGASLDAFPPMVLSGSSTAFFHETTSGRKVAPGEPVLIDCGCRSNFYCGDVTRTFANGCRGKEFNDALEAVSQAKRAAERKAKPGASVKEITRIAEQVIAEHGFKQHSFAKEGLALGHHVGLNVHDAPLKGTLRKGFAITIEPGVYKRGEFGARLEDTLVV
ncbi:MAG: Xaa-Pro peptidase family protein [Candidatus Micrarchaeota archaeon]